MFHDRHDLAALIGSRICHDLISPLGAISNGLELLAMTGQESSPELELITESIASANSKIRFFRVAYGRAPNAATLAQPEIRSILGEYFKGARLNMNWHPLREIQRREAKIVFLAIQCLESALPFGGQIDVRLDGTEWTLSAHSDKMRVDPELWTRLEGQQPAPELAAAQVQFGMLAMLTQWRKPALSVALGDNSVVIRC